MGKFYKLKKNGEKQRKQENIKYNLKYSLVEEFAKYKKKAHNTVSTLERGVLTKFLS